MLQSGDLKYVVLNHHLLFTTETIIVSLAPVIIPVVFRSKASQLAPAFILANGFCLKLLP